MDTLLLRTHFKAGAVLNTLCSECNEKAQTEITHDACLGFFVTFIQRDEEERAGVRCNKVSISRPYPTKVFA
ncbi:hypothetical protein LIP72_16015, partial [Mediterraneibacter faecis]|uniref:hypothetical protein n=1 Tax=Mediterraneibacter faecis TaxID=592978 RepID=UPI001D01D514